MDKFFKIITIVGIYLTTTSVSAQDKDSKYDLSLIHGFTFAGPSGQLSKYIRENNFDAVKENYVFLGSTSTKYPVETSGGISLALNYRKYITSKRNYNFQIGFSDFGRVSGYNNSQGDLRMDFYTFYGSIFYTLKEDIFEINVGPVLMYNFIAYNEKLRGSELSKESKISIGLNLGGGIRLWNTRRTYGSINLDYTYAVPNKFTPKTSSSESLPSSKINFRHARTILIFGIHLY